MLELCFRSIIGNINAEKELSKYYEKLALEAHYDTKCLHKVEDHVPRNIKKRLYEVVS